MLARLALTQSEPSVLRLSRFIVGGGGGGGGRLILTFIKGNREIKEGEGGRERVESTRGNSEGNPNYRGRPILAHLI